MEVHAAFGKGDLHAALGHKVLFHRQVPQARRPSGLARATRQSGEPETIKKKGRPKKERTVFWVGRRMVSQKPEAEQAAPLDLFASVVK